MVGGVVRYLDFGADSVSTGNAGKAGVYGRVVYSAAFAAFLETFAGKPVIAPAWLTLLTVWIETTILSGNVGAFERACFETVFSGLLLGFCGKVARL